MKKVMLGLVAIASLLQISCKRGPSAHELHVAAADAEGANFAAENFRGFLSIPGYGLSAYLGTIVTFAGAMSAGAASQKGINTAPPPSISYGALPPQYLLENNPYEMIGISHNEAVNIILMNGGLTEIAERLRNDDRSAYSLFLSNPIGGNSPTQQEISDITDFLINNSGAWKNLDSDNGPVTWAMIDNPSTSSHTYDQLLRTIKSIYLDMKHSNASSDEVYGYLNNQISDLIPSNINDINSELKAAIIYLTVLKHSDYYWGSNY